MACQPLNRRKSLRSGHVQGERESSIPSGGTWSVMARLHRLHGTPNVQFEYFRFPSALISANLEGGGQTRYPGRGGVCTPRTLHFPAVITCTAVPGVVGLVRGSLGAMLATSFWQEDQRVWGAQRQRRRGRRHAHDRRLEVAATASAFGCSYDQG